MKPHKPWPHVAALILVGTTVLLHLIIPPKAGTHEPVTLQSAPRHLIEREPSTVEIRTPDERDSWDKFSAEFGDDREAASAFLAPISEAKYQIDFTIFTVKTAIHRLEDLLELRYSNGQIGRADTFRTPSPAYLKQNFLTFEDARLKFDFEMASGKPYVGVRLVLPFGN